MKKIILIIIIIIELLLIDIPSYVELNNLAIIEEIGIIEESNHYTLILKEIIPIKDNQGISYEYKIYQKKSISIEKAYKYLQNSTKKKLYITKTKSLITNMNSTEEVLKILNLKPQTITHSTEDILKKIKED